jgi:NAD+ synthase/NAD+ synthase (glutamine-hydrolysing)
MKVTLLQLNPTVGDIGGNAQRIVTAVRMAEAESPDLIVTPELALNGYPPRDLLLVRKFVSCGWDTLHNIAGELKDSPPVLIGLAEPNIAETGRPLFNSAVLIHAGTVRARFKKTLLPTYDVFDEDRYFEPSQDRQVLRLGDTMVGISICEDIWNDWDFWNRRRYRIDPIEELVESGAQIIINISASPFTIGKQQVREKMLASVARKYHVPLIYVNQVGGNDDLVFDGRSCAFDGRGHLIARAAAFREDALTVDTSQSYRNRITDDDFAPEPEIWRALVLGTRDYVRKTGFSSVLLGLSGGVDSAIVAAIAAEAVGKENVLGVLMPSPFSSKGSIDDSLQLAANLGIRTTTVPITPVMDAFDDVLRPEFVKYEQDVTEENLQARIRGVLLMALSNKYGALLLNTGNKSEVSVGYCTLYGDMCGAIAVISDVPKTMVYRIARWLNATHSVGIIPDAILVKPPSAELRPGQRDEDILPPYELLDQILYHHIELHESQDEIIAHGFDPETVRWIAYRIKTAEFKRKQSAPGIKVTDRAFGTGWRMPIASGEWDPVLKK